MEHEHMVAIQTWTFDEALKPNSDAGGIRVRGRGVNGRDGGQLKASRFPIDSGIPGLNMSFGYYLTEDGFFSPRHHHNFDQFRYCASGVLNIGKNLDMHEGECGYFPEGTYYGPQDQKGDGIQVVLQFPGPNASYYMVGNDSRGAAQRLIDAGGVFENGVYRGKTPDGRAFNKDGFEAVWEEANGHPVEYSAERYADPVIMKSASYRWVDDASRPGLRIKHLGTFTEYQTQVALWQLAPGTVLAPQTLSAPEVRFVLSGDTIYAGKELGTHSCYYIPDGEQTVALEARGGAELLVISLPMYVRAVWEQASNRKLVAA
jgi:hypothetical protein